MEFDEVLVPAENLLGKENQGFEIIMSSEYLFQTQIHIPRLTISSLRPRATVGRYHSPSTRTRRLRRRISICLEA
jgi:hypothetical protein